jgi:hypothetical protein
MNQQETPLDRFVAAARAYCVALGVYDKKSNPANLRNLTLALGVMREAYRAEQQAP